MANGVTFFPSGDSQLLAWSLNFLTKIQASPVTYNLTAAQATAYATVHGNYATALAGCDPSVRTPSAVLAKNAAREQLKLQAKLLANQVNASATVTDAQKRSLGLNVRAQPRPVPAPAASPIVEVMSVSAWMVSVRLKSTDVARRGKPLGVSGASVFSYVGPTPPNDIAAWKFEGNTGKTKVDVLFPSSLAAGTRVWLSAFWFNGRKQSGPACPPVATNLQGGGVQTLAA